ncbi:hypothetical protein B0J14DRAFT_704932 [Halenospora varia]|nr:hypothetical protein B0J14DRAFT_704932 [Halenospora varia]
MLYGDSRGVNKSFMSMRDRARSLRDGIFALTSVTEAREARLLGENARLLTYVTVFYLPLSFCTSMWAINEMFGAGTRGFAIITSVITFVTYLSVFCLTKLVVLADILDTIRDHLPHRKPTKPEEIRKARSSSASRRGRSSERMAASTVNLAVVQPVPPVGPNLSTSFMSRYRRGGNAARQEKESLSV